MVYSFPSLISPEESKKSYIYIEVWKQPFNKKKYTLIKNILSSLSKAKKSKFNLRLIKLLLKKVKDEIVATMNKKTEIKGHTIPKNWIGLAIFVVILIIMSVVFADAANQETVDLGKTRGEFVVSTSLPSISGYTDENSESQETVNISSENVLSVTFTLIWTDEADLNGRDNEPDFFSLEVTTPWGETEKSEESANTHEEDGGSGSVTLTVENPSEEKYNTVGTGDYIVVVKAGVCGDQVDEILGIPLTADDGNEWSLWVNYTHRVKGGNNRKIEVVSGHSDENTDKELTIYIKDQNIVYINFTLVWKDEEDEEGTTNEPDYFAINVTTPWNESKETEEKANEHGKEGSVSLSFINPSKEEKNKVATGEYKVIIKCGDCGDQWYTSPHTVGWVDDGNDWTLIIEYYYNVEFVEPEMPAT